jgi:hypothetical protein
MAEVLDHKWTIVCQKENTRAEKEDHEGRRMDRRDIHKEHNQYARLREDFPRR